MLGLLVAAADGASARALSPAEQRGRSIYVTGTSAAGRPLQATIGGAAVPASAVPCAGCHGRDGRGGTEGGLTAPPITWAELTKPYGHAHWNGRRHGPYTAPALVRTIREGVDPAGHRLDPAMPTYAFGDADQADLVAFLQALGDAGDPGVGEARVVVGTVLPETGPLAGAAASVRATLNAFFDEVNRQGGVYGRRVDLRVTAALEVGDVLAWVAPLIAGREAEAAAVAEREAMPVVGAFSLFPPSGAAARYLFAVTAGVGDQARALVDFLAGRRGRPLDLAIVHPGGPQLQAVLDAVTARAVKHRGTAVAVEYTRAAVAIPDVAGRLDGRDAVVFLGSAAEGTALIAELARRGATPDVVVPAALLGPEPFDLPPSWPGRVYLAYPPGPLGVSRAGAAAFRDLAERHGLGTRHLPVQLAAYWASAVLVEGLKRAGRDVDREALVTSLETLRDFDAGLTVGLGYGPARRVAAAGAFVVPARPAPGEAATWVALDD